ncbi:MAG: hypothetical protein KDK36_15170, partial [Leptospiraceae bacterium]|nr:hypothetical protein [Leptospiraceae bacterium]
IDISVLIILQFLWSGDFEYNKHSHLSNFGQYTSGTIGLIITGISVYFFYKTLILQRKEFELQREELKNNVDALKSQKIEMEIQNNFHLKNQLDNKFFNLLSFLLNIRSSFSQGNKDGNQYFSEIIAEIDTRFELVDYRFQKIRSINNYFSHLCNIIKLIVESEFLDNHEKETYFNILCGVLRKQERDVIIKITKSKETIYEFGFEYLINISENSVLNS